MCKKGAKINAKFSQHSWYYAGEGVEENTSVRFFTLFFTPFFTTLGEVQYFCHILVNICKSKSHIQGQFLKIEVNTFILAPRFMGLMNFKCLKPHQKLHQNHTKNPGNVSETRGQDLYIGTKVYGINEF